MRCSYCRMSETHHAGDAAKSWKTSSFFEQEGNNSFGKGDFGGATKNYTLALLHLPPVGQHNHTKTNATAHSGFSGSLLNKSFEVRLSNSHLFESPTKVLTDYPLGLLYAYRSAAAFRLKEYKCCVQDILRAGASGSHNIKQQSEILSRLAWSYWHLKEYQKCDVTLKKLSNLIEMDSDIGVAKEMDILQSLLLKINMRSKHETNSNSKHSSKVSPDQSIEEKNGVQTAYEDSKGRYLTAKKYFAPNEVIFEEVSFCGVLNKDFEKTHCSFCFKECAMFGIPCFGCSTSLYCDESCRNSGWMIYHWLECCMAPVLDHVDQFSRVALRMILTGAHKMLRLETDDHTCSSIAAHIKETLSNLRNSSARNKKHKPIGSQSQWDGRNPASGKYQGDYWSVYCLQTHITNHSKLTLSRSEEVSRLLARVVEQCVQPVTTPSPKGNSSAHKSSLSESAQLGYEVKRVLNQLSFDKILQRKFHSSAFDIELFRNHVRSVCTRFADKVSDIGVRQQTHFATKDLPKTFYDVLTYLFKHHILQLYTNSQAITDVVTDQDKANPEISTSTQRRIATCIFPSVSLMNHSCDCNTVLSFTGSKVKVKAMRSIDGGCEITHCYGPSITRHSLKDRQNMLKQQYFFDCRCLACTKQTSGDPDELAFLLQFTAYKCTACDGPVTIIDSNNETILGKCVDESCKKLHNLTVSQLLFNQTLEQASIVTRKTMKGVTEQGLKTLLDSLEKFKSILYKHHQAMAAVHDQIAYCYSHLGNYSSAIPHVLKSLKVVSMKFGSKSMEATRETYKLATLYFKTSQFDFARKQLTKVLPIFRASLPKENPELAEAEAMNSNLELFKLSKNLTAFPARK